jgi:hypothetical protein
VQVIAQRFVGGMNVPTNLGRVNATWPLAVLTVDDQLVTLRVSMLGRLSPVRVSVAPSAIKVAYLMRVHVLTPGVGLDLTDGRVLYFWTWANKREVLDALRGRAVPIDPVARALRRSFRGEPWVGSVADRRNGPRRLRGVGDLAAASWHSLYAAMTVVRFAATRPDRRGW